MEILSTSILLLFILDPFGNIPLLLSVLKNVDDSKKMPIIIRELLIGLAILILFLFFGEKILDIFGLEQQAITIAGGIIFFIISLKMIFPDPNGKGIFTTNSEDELLIVPIAMPMISGPGAIATVILLAKSHPHQISSVLASILLAWTITSVILILSPQLSKILKPKGLTAMERLMGMLLLMMSVEMFIRGVRELMPTFVL